MIPFFFLILLQMKKLIVVAALMMITQVNAQKYFVKADSVPELRGSSIRGMSVVDDSVAWISGSKGCVARTLNGGKTWERFEMPAKYDFRAIEAFDKDHAYLMCTIDTAAILFTSDGGKSWSRFYNSGSKEIFFDAISFWDKNNGLILTDPLNGKFGVMRIKNGRVLSAIKDTTLNAKEGEACFAASGTCLRTGADGFACFVTGGARSRYFYSSDSGMTWKYMPLPILQGKSTQGAFSVALKDSLVGVIVGGDYAVDQWKEKNCFVTMNAGKRWFKPKTGPLGYRSCVEYVGDNRYICTGTSGTDLSYDSGVSWLSINSKSFNVIRKAKKGNLILIAGDKGRVGVVIEK
jgi:photosystem II stability/assembly factor-like uncharacterized protein